MAKKNIKFKPVPHIQTLIDNVKEVERLVEIHTKISGSTKGYKHNMEALNKSSIVLLVACWEAYIEDLAKTAFNFLLQNTVSPRVFSNKVLTLASKELKNSSNEIKVWELAGDGWKQILTNHSADVIKRFIGNFNTPRPEKIDDLFESLIGLKSLSSHWSWKGISVRMTSYKLNQLVTLRGEIAHRVAANVSVTKSTTIYYKDFIQRLAVKSHNTVGVFLRTKTQQNPWPEYQFGQTG